VCMCVCEREREGERERESEILAMVDSLKCQLTRFESCVFCYGKFSTELTFQNVSFAAYICIYVYVHIYVYMCMYI